VPDIPTRVLLIQAQRRKVPDRSLIQNRCVSTRRNIRCPLRNVRVVTLVRQLAVIIHTIRMTRWIDPQEWVVVGVCVSVVADGWSSDVAEHGVSSCERGGFGLVPAGGHPWLFRGWVGPVALVADWHDWGGDRLAERVEGLGADERVQLGSIEELRYVAVAVRTDPFGD
jgi:hypothetical protein